MKTAFLVVALCCLTLVAPAQRPRLYITAGTEMNFTYAIIDNRGNDEGSVLRFAPVFNLQGFANYDPGNVFGFFTGLGIRNVGFIYEVPGTGIKMKYRTYDLCIPVGIKVGVMDHVFLFAGYEVEFPFNYKEKKVENGNKDKFSEWFSGRVEPVQHGFLTGIRFPYGIDLKFKYYLTNFHDREYTEASEQGEAFPYKDLTSNICLVSLGWNFYTSYRENSLLKFSK